MQHQQTNARQITHDKKRRFHKNRKPPR